MEKIKNNDKFIEWCKRLYDENCLERHRHGLYPYESFEVYYNKHTEWLKNKYEDENRVSYRSSLYLS